MPIPIAPKPYYLKTPIERELDASLNKAKKHFNNNPNKNQLKFITAEIGYIKTIASIQSRVEKYKKEATSMSLAKLQMEKHSSKRLGEHMRAAGKPKPDNRCDAHAIVSGAHPDAIEARYKLALVKIRIDDPDNGCWLPRTIADTPHWAFKNAIAHSQIHRANCCHWIKGLLGAQPTEGLVRVTLRNIEHRLHQRNFPPYVMLPKGVSE